MSENESVTVTQGTGVLPRPGPTETESDTFSMDTNNGVVTVPELTEDAARWLRRKPKLLGRFFGR